MNQFTRVIIIIAMMMGSPYVFSDNPIVLIETRHGDIELELFVEEAPLSAAAFLYFVDNKLFEEGGAFYRTVRPDNDSREINIQIIQGGLLDLFKPYPPIAHESTIETGIRHQDGVISLARNAVGTATGMAFFICIGDQPALDHGGKRMTDGEGTSAFGRVTKGMEVVRKIHQLETESESGNAWFGEQAIKTPVQFLKVSRKPD